MTAVRALVVALIAAALAIGFVLDEEPRPTPDVRLVQTTSVPEVGEGAGIWFCPGGSSPNGPARVSLELANAGTTTAIAVVSGIRSGTGPEPLSTERAIEPGSREVVPLAELVPDSAWMAAVVEVEGADVVVEQTVIGEASGLDRVPCHSTTSSSWLAASGATRVTEFGEELSLLVMNPFLDDAVLDVAFDSDVGVDSLPGVVVPARRVVMIDVTEAVTVARRVSATIDVVAGRVAVGRLQLVANEERQGLAATPASAGAAPVWYLPVLHRGVRDDVISVVNPTDEEAKVDLEIVADGDLQFDPIELTVRPGRTVQVSLADEARLDGVQRLAVIARSLTGTPIAVMAESSLSFGDGNVSNLAAMSGVDGASTRWITPIESDAGSIVVLNPSSESIAVVDVTLAGPDGPVDVATLELAPGRWAEVSGEDLGGDLPIAIVDASSPVVVARVEAGVSSYGVASAFAAAPVTTAR